MNKLTKGLLAASLLGVGAIGTGIAISANAANANEYETAEYDALTEEIESIELVVEGDNWTLLDVDGEILEDGESNGDIFSTSITETITENGESEIIDIVVESFETEEELDTWWAEHGWHVDEE